tara:strand:+ start:97 stop:1161 length:1065 start_codon:yes stop_codon:yes gene_type:complete
MYKKDGSPDLRFSVNRRGSSGTISSFEISLANSLFKDANKKAYLLRDFRSELLQLEPNLIKTLFKLAKDQSWYETSYTYNWPDLEWLAKETPEVVIITSSGDSGYDYKDSFEEQIEKLEDEYDDIFETYDSIVEDLLKSYLDNKLEANILLEDEVLFEKNINIIDRIVSNALDVEKKILRKEEEFRVRQMEKEEIRLAKWISDYGYCTRNSAGESVYLESMLPLTRKELQNVKNKTVNDDVNVMADLYQGIKWLDNVSYDSTQIIRLKYLTNEEILYVKKEFVLMDDPNVCDLEIKRRSDLKFWKKLYEIIFIRILFEPNKLVKLLLFALLNLFKFIFTKVVNWIKVKLAKTNN